MASASRKVTIHGLFNVKWFIYNVLGATKIVKRLSTMRETRVRSLGQVDPLEKEMATHFSIHA